MRILGIDPGTATTGFGVIEIIKGKAAFIDAGVITTPKDTPMQERLGQLYDCLTQIIAETKPGTAAIELLFFAQNTTTAISVAQARGVIMLACHQAGLSIAEYTPLQVKQAMTGYGKATKAQMQEMVRLQLGLDDIPRPDDAADGLALALTATTGLLGKP